MRADCPLCDGPCVDAFVTKDRNRGVRDDLFLYRRCVVCDALHLVDVPQDLAEFYSEGYFPMREIGDLRAHAREEGYRIELVRRHARSGRLIEIGSGGGVFALQALEAGFDVAAIEPSTVAAAYLRGTLGIEVVQSATPEETLAALGPAQAIVAWHVLEHVPDPWRVIKAAAETLAPGGVLVIATPNPRALGFRVLSRRWPHVDAPRHLFLLPHRAVIAQGRAVGLQPVQLTATDPGGLGWNAFAWRYVLRRPGSSWLRERVAQHAGSAIAFLLAPVERRRLRGAAYTLVLRKGA